MRSLQAVSYTHLDVYKRQMQNRSVYGFKNIRTFSICSGLPVKLILHHSAVLPSDSCVTMLYSRSNTLIWCSVSGPVSYTHLGHARDLSALLEKTEVVQLLIPAGCKEIKTNKDLIAQVRSAGAKEVDTEQVLYTGEVPITVFPVTDGKLGVQIADKILVLHSPTQKQLAAFLEQTDAPPSAPEVVLSQRNLEDEALLNEALDAVKAERILLQARTRTCV